MSLLSLESIAARRPPDVNGNEVKLVSGQWENNFFVNCDSITCSVFRSDCPSVRRLSEWSVMLSLLDLFFSVEELSQISLNTYRLNGSKISCSTI